MVFSCLGAGAATFFRLAMKLIGSSADGPAATADCDGDAACGCDVTRLRPALRSRRLLPPTLRRSSSLFADFSRSPLADSWLLAVALRRSLLAKLEVREGAAVEVGAAKLLGAKLLGVKLLGAKLLGAKLLGAKEETGAADVGSVLALKLSNSSDTEIKQRDTYI